MHKGERMKISILSVTIRLHGSVRFDSSKNFSRRFPNLWQRVSRGILPLTVTEAAAKSLGIKLQSLEVRSLDDFESAFARAKKERSQALITTPGPLVATQQRQVLDFAAESRLPAMYSNSEFVEAGGLMSYAPNYMDLFRRTADLVDKILKGTKTADLPIDQPKKFEFIINLKAAKQIGLTIPPNVLARADKVIR
jgi:putative tryptophan/tyrosine transport system substrate-binding protein